MKQDQDFYLIIESAIFKVAGNQEYAKEFLSKATNLSRFVLGKNDDSAAIIRQYKIDGVVDDFSVPNSFWNNVPLINSSNLPSDAIIINCSTSISPISADKILLKTKARKILSLNELLYAANGKLALPWFVEQMRTEYNKDKSNWQNLYFLLTDSESQKTLLDIMRYRLTADLAYMQAYSVRLNEQYFEDFMQFDNEVFVDAGGFDGDTTIEFCRRYPNYKEVLFFEPSIINLKAAKEQTKNFRDIVYYEVGLSDKEELLSFDPSAGSASSVTQNGSQIISVTTLDSLVIKPVSFIKMDLEGWELKALSGCKNHIIQDSPKLAIAVYHNSSDFYEIPNYILSLNSNYDVYLRHYTEGWSETVMYFVPKSIKSNIIPK